MPCKIQFLRIIIFWSLIGLLHFRKDFVSTFNPLNVASPVLNISERYLDVPVKTSLYLLCKGGSPLVWNFENPLTKKMSRLSVLNESAPTASERYFTSTVLLEFHTYENTGIYSCSSKSRFANNSFSVFIFVNDISHIMLPLEVHPFMLLYAFDEEPVTIPCLPTHSSTNVTLWKSSTTNPNLNAVESFCKDANLVTSGVSFDPTKGFAIASSLSSLGLYCCLATLEANESSIDFAVVARADFVNANIMTIKQPSIVKSSFTLGYEGAVRPNRVYYGWIYNAKYGKLRTVFFPRIEKRPIIVAKLQLEVINVQKSQNMFTSIVMDRTYHASTGVQYLPVYELGDPDLNKAEGESIEFAVKLKKDYYEPRSQGIWQKDATDILFQNTRCQVSFNTSVSMLTIDNVTFEDSGIYSYSIDYPGLIRTSGFALRVIGKPKIEATSVQPPGQQLKSKIYELVCTAKCIPLPDLKLLWKPLSKGPSDDDVHFEIECETGKYFPNILENARKNESFNYYSVSLGLPVKIDTPGTYFCRSNNRLGVAEEIIPFIKKGKPYATYRGLPVLRPKKSNGALAITCAANGSIYKDIEIKKSFGEISDVRMTKTSNSSEHLNQINSKLIFDRISSNISGLYECLASHRNQSLPPKKRSLYIFANDQTNPFVYETNMDSSIDGADRNETVELFCYVSGSPRPKVLWFHKELRMLSFRAGTKLLDDSQRLVIANFSRDNDGLYKCRAENTIEAETRSKSLYVREAPYVIETNMNSTDTYENEGTHFEFLCYFGGMPPINITWYFNDQQITENTSRAELRDESRKLLFRYIDKRDNGLYKCKAENDFGSFERSTKLTVRKEPELTSKELAEIIGVSLAVVLLIGVLSVLIGRLILRKKKASTQLLCPAENRNPAISKRKPKRLKMNKQYEFPRGRIKLGRTLGKGTFGIVVKARATGIFKHETKTTVAVKMPKDALCAIQKNALLSELKIMMNLGHHLNILNLLGAVTRNPRELMAIVEYCRYGCLRKYLLRRRKKFRPCSDSTTYDSDTDEDSNSSDSESAGSPPEARPPIRKRKIKFNETSSVVKPKPGGFASESAGSDSSDTFFKEMTRNLCITTKDLLSYSFQCARGMDYMASKDMIHRDIAARNVLVADNGVVKICDFGLSEDMWEHKIVKQPEEVPVPLKWMAVESIEDKVFSPKTDVWSFGVLLWEIFSLGAEPYPGDPVDENFLLRLKGGHRMAKPDFAPDNIYDIMQDCWCLDPNDRPDFARLSDILGDTLDKNVRQYYIKLNNPYEKINQDVLISGCSEDVEISEDNRLCEGQVIVSSSHEIQDNTNIISDAKCLEGSDSESPEEASVPMCEFIYNGQSSLSPHAKNSDQVSQHSC